MARTVAKTALITEAHPFIPQAQGRCEGNSRATRVNPKGKGIPIKKARGAIKATDMAILIPSEADEKEEKTVFNPPK